MVELGRSSTPHKGKSIARQGTGRRYNKRSEENIQILREVWMDIGIEKVDMHEGITVKALLDSGAMGMFIDQKMVEKYGFRLQKLKRLIMVRNVDGTNNSAGAITH